MVAESKAIVDPQNRWLENASASLLESYDCRFDFWTRSRDLGWVSVELTNTEESRADFSDAHGEAIDRRPLDHLLEQVISEGIPGVTKLASKLYLLAMPLNGPAGRPSYVATSIFETDIPGQLLQMGKISQRSIQQELEIERLGEENRFFLQQVSDDFEELTFLRYMAERLSLGEGTNTIHHILDESLQRLGEAIKVESLCFIDGQAGAVPRVETVWQAEGQEIAAIDAAVLVEIVENHREAAKLQPVIKNHVEEIAVYPGVCEFILVAVSTSMSEVGWLLAVNRKSASSRLDNMPILQTSQYEFGTNEASLLSTAAAMIASHANNLNLFQERETLLVSVVRALVSAVEAKDGYTCGHSERVALFAKRLAQQVGYNEEDCELLYLTGLLHDVGKIGISDAILKKTDALTEEEFAEIQKHPDEGWAILRELKQLSYVLPGVLHHHERYDGGGYPDRLTGEEIPLDGRVLAVADAFDAMTSDRAYRQGMPQKQAEEILRAGAGTQWDQRVIDAFFEISEELSTMRENYETRERPVRQPSKFSSAN